MCSQRLAQDRVRGRLIRRKTLPGLAVFDNGVGITGSGGFIGSHLTSALGTSGGLRDFRLDVTDRESLEAVAQTVHVRSLVHLAAAGSVVVDIDAVPRMLAVTVGGLVNCLSVFQPDRIIFSSSCSVYGNTPLEGASPSNEFIRPLGAYGLTKLLAEDTLERWSRKNASLAISLRFGNVVGARCSGLIRYLVRHALRYPKGDTPAQMRGAGKIVRDYVPVNYAVRAAEQALKLDWATGFHIYNVGSGITMTNGEVAEVVRESLRVEGYELNIHFDPDPDLSEAAYSRLITSATELALNVVPPTPEEVREAIRDGVRSLLAIPATAAGAVRDVGGAPESRANL